MMPLSLQPAIPPAPLDGISIPAQSRDSESLTNSQNYFDDDLEDYLMDDM